MPRAVGIDFGTTTVVVSVLEHGKPVFLTTAEGDNRIPAIVAFSQGECLIGTAAKKKTVLNPQGTICAVKSFLGKAFTQVSQEIARVPYQVARGPHDAVRIRVQEQLYAPEEIAALLLRYILDEASRCLGEKIQAAVIAVPATFTHTQRQAIHDAATIAGLHLLQLVNETTATALAYGVQKKRSASVLVFDIGSGAAEVAILDIDRGACEVRVSGGDPRLGADDFDRCLVDHVIEAVKKENGIDIRSDPHAVQLLYEAVERAKCELSSASQTILSLSHLFVEAEKPKDLTVTISRAQFEALTEPLVHRCARLIWQAFADAKMNPSDIDEVLLVGGASRMPAVQALVGAIMRGKVPVREINPEETVAAGAALLAGILTGQAEHMVVFEATPLSLRMETSDGQRKVVIQRNTPLPCRKTEVVSTTEENQAMTGFLLLQGSSENEENLSQVGYVTLEGIRPAPPGVPQIEVAFDLDANGLLAIQAKDRETGAPCRVSLVSPANLDRDEIEHLRRKMEQYMAAERDRRQTGHVRNEIDALIHQLQKGLTDLRDRVAMHERLRCEQLIGTASQALKEDTGRAELLRVHSDLQQAVYGLFAIAAYEHIVSGEAGAIDHSASGDDANRGM